ncbi:MULTISPECIES: hypothetical protein [unclassified Thioalkalivibrio]|uniref:hypothetical protein n=1 Tax=unclassified Thioalkalivibrio TaxID=2621013 RepID=UPI0012DC7537|nr:MULTISPECIES: hypothetical protein [unclassified Thioalkalivibrio]
MEPREPQSELAKKGRKLARTRERGETEAAAEIAGEIREIRVEQIRERRRLEIDPENVNSVCARENEGQPVRTAVAFLGVYWARPLALIVFFGMAAFWIVRGFHSHS